MPGNGKIFVSHTHADNERCAPLLAALDAWGVDYWYDGQQLEAGQVLTPRLQSALQERDILLRVCTTNSPNSYWMNLELSAFRTIQFQEERQQRSARGKRKAIDLVLDIGYQPASAEQADATINAALQSPRLWLGELRDALGVKVARRSTPAVSRRTLLEAGLAGVVTVGALGTTGGVAFTRQRAAAAPYPQPKTVAFPSAPALDPRTHWFLALTSDAGFGLAAAGENLIVSSDDGLYAVSQADGNVVWWRDDIQGRADAAPVVVGDVIYVVNPGLTSTLFALHAADGSTIWSVPVNSSIQDTNVAYHNSALYMRDDNDHVVAFSTSGGSTLWTSSVKIPSSSLGHPEPVATDYGVIIGGGDGMVYCFNPANGAMSWQFPTEGAINDDVATGPVAAYVASADHHVYAISPFGGELWRYTTEIEPIYGPTLANGLVYLGVSGEVVALEAASGSVRWTEAPSGSAIDSIGSRVSVAGSLAVVPMDSGLYAFDANTGKGRWQIKSGGSGLGSVQPYIAGDTVYWATGANLLLALSAS